MSTVSLASRRGHFSTLDELTGCIRASMLVPGLAGPLLSVPTRRPSEEQLAPLSSANVATSRDEARDIMAAAVGSQGREESKQEPTIGFLVGESATALPQADGGQTPQTEGGDNNGVAAEEEVKDSAVAAVGEAAVAATAAASAAFENSVQKEEEGGGGDATELLVDAMVFEPLPYRWSLR